MQLWSLRDAWIRILGGQAVVPQVHSNKAGWRWRGLIYACVCICVCVCVVLLEIKE